MNFMKQYAQSVFCTFIIKISSLFKVSYIIGSQIAFFSVSSVITPIAGAFIGVTGSSLVLLFRFLMHYLVFKTVSLSFLAFCVPGYCASLYWASSSVLVRVGLPVACMVLFMAHPVGTQAFIYSFYWLIPVYLFVSGKKTLFSKALGSTFTAHAVGSVIWLYTTPTTANMWMGLIPVVAIERLLFAVGMVVVYQVIMYVKNMTLSFDTPNYAFKRCSALRTNG